jgi:hypothetical protein
LFSGTIETFQLFARTLATLNLGFPGCIAAKTEELERQSENLRSRDVLIKKLNAEITALKRTASGPWW